jgi:hypothetical protein
LNIDRYTVNGSPPFVSALYFLSFSIALLPCIALNSNELDPVRQVQGLRRAFGPATREASGSKTIQKFHYVKVQEATMPVRARLMSFYSIVIKCSLVTIVSDSLGTTGAIVF